MRLLKINIGDLSFLKYFSSFFLSRSIIFFAPLVLLFVGEDELYVQVEAALGIAILLSAFLMSGQNIVLILMASSADPVEKIESLKLSLIVRSLPCALFAIAFSNHNFALTLSFVSLVVIQTTVSGLHKAKGHRIRGLISETSLYFIILCFGFWFYQTKGFDQNVKLSLVIGSVSIWIILDELRANNFLIKRALAIDFEVVKSGLAFMMTGCTLVIATTFSRTMLPLIDVLEDQVIYASSFRFAMVGLLLHQLLAGYIFKDLYNKKIKYIIKVAFFSGLMVFFASLISLTLVDSGLLWAQIQFQSLGAFYLTLIFACNVSLISILSFMEIVMQRINVSILSRSVLFTTSMVSLILFWLGSMVFDITIKNLMMAHSLLLCVLLAISSFIIVANYRLHNWTDFNQKL
jgi:hypothetical protein